MYVYFYYDVRLLNTLHTIHSTICSHSRQNHETNHLVGFIHFIFWTCHPGSSGPIRTDNEGQQRRISHYPVSPHCLKTAQNVALQFFPILAFITIFWPIKTDLEILRFIKIRQIDHLFWHVILNLCLIKIDQSGNTF